MILTETVRLARQRAHEERGTVPVRVERVTALERGKKFAQAVLETITEFKIPAAASATMTRRTAANKVLRTSKEQAATGPTTTSPLRSKERPTGDRSYKEPATSSNAKS
jgi:hypothetical protein